MSRTIKAEFQKIRDISVILMDLDFSEDETHKFCLEIIDKLNNKQNSERA